MVGCWNSKNSFLTNRSTLLDLPTAVSPSSTSLKFTVLAMTQGGEAREEWTERRKEEVNKRSGVHQEGAVGCN